MSEWFQSKVKFLRQMDNGLIKSITEQYLVDAMSFTEAEARVTAEIGEGMRKVTMRAISRSNIKEVVFYGDTDLFWKVKVKYALMDEETEKEKKITTYLLVNANDAKEAYERTEEHLKEMLAPFTIDSVVASPIIDVYQYEQALRPKASDTVVQDLQNEAAVSSVTLTHRRADGSEKSVTLGKPINPTNGQAHGFDIDDFDPQEWYDRLDDMERATITHCFSTVYLGGDSTKFVSYLSAFGLETEQVTAVIEWLEGGEDETEIDCAMESQKSKMGIVDPTGLTQYLESVGLDAIFNIAQLNRIVEQAEKLQNITEFSHWVCNEWHHRNGITMDQAGAIYKILN